MLASKIGTSHLKNNTSCQDAAAAFPIASPIFSGRKDFWFAAIVSDGAGSTSHGGEGAKTVCHFLKERILRHLKKKASLPSQEQLRQWVLAARETISTLALQAGDGLSIRDFACTLVLFLGNSRHQLSAHIGDGAIVTCGEDDRWQCFSEPHHGEYAATTYFLTDDEPKIRIKQSKAKIKAVCVFSDGIEALALDLKKNEPHQPFFSILAAPLKRSFFTKRVGCDKILSEKLGALLESNRVCSRTDDDKTVILALVK